MALTSWQDHVVHIGLYGHDSKPTQGYARLLTERFAGRAFCAVVDDCTVEVRSEPASPVSAAEVARTLAEVDLPAAAVFERLEWSVGQG